MLRRMHSVRYRQHYSPDGERGTRTGLCTARRTWEKGMDDAQIWELLERGSTLGAAHYEVDGVHRLRRFERFDPLADPVAAQQLGTALAAQLGDGAYNLVTIWDTVENAVLGFLVGLALQCPVVRVFDHEGLIRE